MKDYNSHYYPGPGNDWEWKKPEEVNINAKLLEEAINFAKEHENKLWPRDFGRAQAALMKRWNRYDDGKLLGPTKNRGVVNGIILRHGYIVAEWGDTKRVDVTSSATKSYLSTVAGLALDKGLIKSVHDPVREYVQDGNFDSPHNSKITWHHLLQQTSEWDGILWDKHYSAGNPNDELRNPEEPGTYFEYNDVRVNLLSLSLLHVWRKPLPQVLKDEIMDLIGASNTWRWYGYSNSWVTIDGLQMQPVSGGSHWGGGLWISSRDHARFGYLFLRRGKWKDQKIISENWINMATTNGEVNLAYGYMWWLNTSLNKTKEIIKKYGRAYDRHWQSIYGIPKTTYFARGGGGNWITVDPEHDLVIITRWMVREKIEDFIIQVLEAIK